MFRSPRQQDDIIGKIGSRQFFMDALWRANQKGTPPDPNNCRLEFRDGIHVKMLLIFRGPIRLLTRFSVEPLALGFLIGPTSLRGFIKVRDGLTLHRDQSSGRRRADPLFPSVHAFLQYRATAVAPP